MAIFRQLRYFGRHSVIFWLLLVTTSSFEIYDDTPGNLDLDEQGNIMEALSAPEPELFRPRDMLIYRLIKSLQGDDNYSFRPWRRYQKPLNQINQLDQNALDTVEREGITKRLTDGMEQEMSGATIGLNPVQKVRPQPKWKSKKGKTTGSHLVCYFKLCAFHYPFRK